mgnify:CR=1 FL=1
MVPTNDSLSPALSKVSVPLIFDLQELEGLLNRKLGTVIYKDDDFGDHDNDHLKITIRKRNPFQLAAIERTLYSRLPLDFTVAYQLPLGIEKSTRFSAVLHLESRLRVLRDWHVQSRSKLREIVWIEAPETKILGIKIKLRKIAEKIFEKEEAGIMKQLDRLIYQELDLKKPVRKIWNDLPKPTLINKELRNIWLVAQPESIVIGQVKGRRIEAGSEQYELKVPMQLSAHVHTEVGSRPDTVGPGPLPKLDYAPDLSDSLDFRVLSVVDFDDAATLANRLLAKQDFRFRDQKVRLDAIGIEGSGRHVIVRAEMAAPVSGTVHLQGIPAYDSASQSLYIDSFEYVVQTGIPLFSTAEAWLHDWLLETIQQKLRLPIGPLVGELPRLIENAVAKSKTGRKVRVDFERMRLYPEKTVVNNTNIQMQIRILGQAKVRLQNIGSGKDKVQASHNKIN